MPLSKKIVAFDLDGTVTESRCDITPSMVLLFHKLLKITKVIIISGSSFKNFESQFLREWNKYEESKVVNNNLIILPTNGSQQYEYSSTSDTWELKFQEKFAPELKERITDILEELILAGDKYGIAKPGKNFGSFYEDRGSQISFALLGVDAPIEIKKTWDPDHKKREKIINEVLSEKLPDAEIVIGGTTTIDILPPGFNKGKGLLLFLEKNGLKIEDIVFVGDLIFPGGNDYSVKEVGIESMSVSGPKDLELIIKKWIS